MIAKNYIKHPDALRFQREMFSNGYHNSPRIMRLMEVIFDWTPTVPDWVKDAKARATQIVKAWKSRQLELFEMLKTKAKKATWQQFNLVLFPEGPEKAKVEKILPECPHRFRPFLEVDRGELRCAGNYRNFCHKSRSWASFTKAINGQYACSN